MAPRSLYTQGMTGKPEAVYELGMELDVDERAVVAHKLLASVHGEASDGDQVDVDAAWMGEIRRRIDEVERGEVQLVSGEESQARVRALLTEFHQ